MKHPRVAIALVAGVLVGIALDRIAHRLWFKEGTPSPTPVAQVAPLAQPAAPAAAPGMDDPAAVYRVPLEDVPVRGPDDAIVTIVESVDFECPFCKRVEPTLKQIAQTYGKKVRFAFRQNPLSIHPNSLSAAIAAEEARATGGAARFWALHDRLFDLPALDRGAIESAAVAVGVPAANVKAAIDGGRYLDRIRRDQTLMNSLGASGTPTFFVNGRKIVGSQPYESFRALVDEELSKAEALVRSGVSPRDVYVRTTEHGSTAPVKIPGAPREKTAAKIPIRPDDPMRGPKVAPVTLVVFSDFQCPFCSKLEPTLKELATAYGDKVRFVWKHQPLAFHENALPAAKAAEAARAAGKFWEMHDRLFGDQASLSDATYARYAKELGIDPARFQREVAAEATAKRIAEDRELAAASGVAGTPTLFINCRKSAGAQPLEALRPFVDEEIKKAEAAQSQGGKIDAGYYDRVCAANVAAEVALR